jgi:glycosyltransferase involved in cell wall biosynthesis
MEKLLLITYAYPPSNTPGVFRIISFVNYFHEFGFDAIVLTASNPTDHMSDEDLCSFVRRQPTVYKAYGLDFKQLAVKLKKFIAHLIKPRQNQQVKTVKNNDKKQQTKKKTLKSTFMRLLEFPDTRIGWVPFAVWKAHRLISKNNIKYILTSSPPHSIQLVGLIIKLLHPKCVWVSDYRDPWTDIQQIRTDLPFLMCRFEKWLERQSHKHSNLIVANTNTNREVLLRKYPTLGASKVVVIPNGVDPNDFNGLTPLRKQSTERHIHCVFVGSLYDGMIDGLLQPLLILKQRKPFTLSKMRFDFIGYANELEQSKVEALSLTEVVKFQGMVSYRDSLQYMLGADLLLYLLPSAKEMGHWIPSKLYTYLPAKRPVLAIIPEGDAAKLIRQLQVGVVFEPSKAGEIAEFLLRFIIDPGMYTNEANLEKEPARYFIRRNLVQELARNIALL